MVAGVFPLTFSVFQKKSQGLVCRVSKAIRDVPPILPPIVFPWRSSFQTQVRFKYTGSIDAASAWL